MWSAGQGAGAGWVAFKLGWLDGRQAAGQRRVGRVERRFKRGAASPPATRSSFWVGGG